jgi:membrane protein YqaA with SNARE-associated domain
MTAPMGVIDNMVSYLESVAHDPILYLFLLFLYSVAAAVFLPIPVEFALFLSPQTPFAAKALVLALGKTVGSILVFYIGFNVEAPIRRWSDRWSFFRAFVHFCEWFVIKLGYVGLYLLLSIPFMSDTVVLYVFAVFNKEGKVLNMKMFALVNFLGAITRCVIVFFAADYLADYFGYDVTL